MNRLKATLLFIGFYIGLVALAGFGIKAILLTSLDIKHLTQPDPSCRSYNCGWIQGWYDKSQDDIKYNPSCKSL